MIRLIVPNEDYLRSYMEAYDEYARNRVSTYAFTDASSCDVFEKFDRYRNERDLRPDRVGEDKYWLVDDERARFIGEVAIRHRLNDALLRRGGHIGYGVRCSEWNRGYGTRLLALALERAKEMRISPVLVTCNDDNLASARVIEKNGFVLEDKVVVSTDGKDILTRRYWKSLFPDDPGVKQAVNYNKERPAPRAPRVRGSAAEKAANRRYIVDLSGAYPQYMVRRKFLKIF